MKTGISFNKFGTDLTDGEILAAIKSAGFDSFFSGANCDEKKIAGLKEISEKIGIVYESHHAPFGGINVIWQEGEAGDNYVARLCNVADICQRYGIAEESRTNTPCGEQFLRLSPNLVLQDRHLASTRFD